MGPFDALIDQESRVQEKSRADRGDRYLQEHIFLGDYGHHAVEQPEKVEPEGCVKEKAAHCWTL